MTQFIEHRNGNRPIEKDIVVLYHKNCADGFGGAWAAWKKLGDSAQYIPVLHIDPPPDGLQDKEIYFIDFMYHDAALIESIVAQNRKVVILDHHKTAEDKMQFAHEYVYDISRSGAVIAWNFFHPDQPVPTFLQYVQDRDLWTWKLPDAEYITTAVDMLPFEFHKWNAFAEALEDPETKQTVIREGMLLKAYQEKLIELLLASNAYEIEFEGHRVWCMNTANFHSRIGSILAERSGIFSVVWRQFPGNIGVSLRSVNGFDVSGIAKKYGGGGHASSAGFEMRNGEPLPWKNL